MSVVRSLGRRGIRVSVLSDDPDCLTRRSRYCREFLHRSDFTRNLPATRDLLLRFAAAQDTVPVLFPTADPDLAALLSLRNELENRFASFLGPQEVTVALSDKAEFLRLSRQHRFPTPLTYAPESRDDFVSAAKSIRYPAILKPATPEAWTDLQIQRVVGYKKALIVSNEAEMLAYYGQLSPWNTDLIVQEYIPGPDDHHYSAHVYMNRHGQPLACFTGQKVRVHPAYAGSGCYVRSVYVPELIETSLRVLRSVDYHGIAVFNFKKDQRNGKFVLHEINPRVSQWNILATQNGVDVPFAAYADATGLPSEPMLRQSETHQYVDLMNDLKSFASYRRDGTVGWIEYVSSLLQRRTVHQLLAWDDLKPFCTGYSNLLRRRCFGGATASEVEAPRASLPVRRQDDATSRERPAPSPRPQHHGAVTTTDHHEGLTPGRR